MKNNSGLPPLRTSFTGVVVKKPLPETYRGWTVDLKHGIIVLLDGGRQAATISSREHFITVIGQTNGWTVKEARKKAVDILAIAEFVEEYLA